MTLYADAIAAYLRHLLFFILRHIILFDTPPLFHFAFDTFDMPMPAATHFLIRDADERCHATPRSPR